MKITLLLSVVLLVLTASAQPSVEALQQAETLYLQGLQAEQDNDRVKAADALAKAADIYEQSLADKNFDNARLHFNLGNVRLAQNRLGLAIHHYAQALNLEPGNEKIAANLELARSRRKDNLAPEEKDRVLKNIVAVHYDTSVQCRRIAFHCVYAILFLTIIVRIFTRKHTAFTAIISITAALALLLGTSLLISHRDSSRPAGVITATVVHAKAGNSNSYQDAFDKPLHDGTEFILLEQDATGQWFHILLENDTDGWIPVTAAILH